MKDIVFSLLVGIITLGIYFYLLELLKEIILHSERRDIVCHLAVR